MAAFLGLNAIRNMNACEQKGREQLEEKANVILTRIIKIISKAQNLIFYNSVQHCNTKIV
jgi:hypothetical protein